MSAFLLDTHVILWLATNPDRIPAEVRTELEQAEEIFVSAVSWYELSQKARWGRLPSAAGLLARWEYFVNELMAQELPLSSEEAIRAGDLRWEHRDPFDRMLVAQAQLNGLCLVTRDETLRNYSEVTVMKWNK